MINFMFIFSFFLLCTQIINPCMRTDFKKRSENLGTIARNPRETQLLFNCTVSVAPHQTHDRYSSEFFYHYLNNSNVPMRACDPFLQFEIINQETGKKLTTCMPEHIFVGSDSESKVSFSVTKKSHRPRLFCFTCKPNPALVSSDSDKTFQQQLKKAAHQSALHFLKRQEKSLDAKTTNKRD